MNARVKVFLGLTLVAAIGVTPLVFPNDIDRDGASSSSSSSSSNTHYVFAGWENWPDHPITGPYVVRAYYNRVG